MQLAWPNLCCQSLYNRYLDYHQPSEDRQSFHFQGTVYKLNSATDTNLLAE